MIILLMLIFVFFSFGQNAIFLLGGQERSERALALLVQSGDIVIMSGASRLSYHGVPRIISGSCKDCWTSELLPETYQDYLSDSRINLNVRQVLKRGINHLQIIE
jgi:alkylated DNA repair protein alkB family protein 1